MFATVTVQPDNPAAKPRQVRISAKVKAAIEAMVHGGLKRCDAAKHAGLTDHSLYVAMTLPHVRAYRADQLQVIRESASARTIAKAEQLMDSATSEHVQADMTKWIAGLEGISPVTKSESTINHKGLGPGLTIIMSQPEPVLVIDSQAHEVEIPNEYRHLPEPVPHPTSRNAQILRGISSSPAKGRGEK